MKPINVGNGQGQGQEDNNTVSLILPETPRTGTSTETTKRRWEIYQIHCGYAGQEAAGPKTVRIYSGTPPTEIIARAFAVKVQGTQQLDFNPPLTVDAGTRLRVELEPSGRPNSVGFLSVSAAIV